MVVLEWLSYAVVLLEVYKIIRNMIKGKKLKEIVKSPDFKILIVSLLISGCFFIPWNKFHYGDQKTKIVYRDTTSNKSIKGINKPASSIKKEISVVKPPLRKRSKVVLQIPSKLDTAKKEVKADNSVSVQNSPNSHIVGGSGNQVGINGDVNINSEKKLSEDYLNAIGAFVDNLVKIKHFNGNNIIVYTENICNYPKISRQIINYLATRGYKATEGFEMRYPPIEQVKIDTFQNNRDRPDKKIINIRVGRFD